MAVRVVPGRITTDVGKTGWASRPFLFTLNMLEPAVPAALAGHRIGRRRSRCQSQPRFSSTASCPAKWRVEWFGDDGRCELQTFTGPTARR
jgi:hypothetical protein